MKRIIVTQRRDEITGRNETRDSLDVMWAKLIYKLGFLPVPVCSELCEDPEYLKLLQPDGIILSGGNDLEQSPIRDVAEKKILDYAAHFKLPVLGVCRGMQFLNYYFGGSLVTVTGHVATNHLLCGKWAKDHAYSKVNSYHNQGVTLETLAEDLILCAYTSDGVVEAVEHIRLPWVGIMWHPERESDFSVQDLNLITKIFNG